MGAVAEVAQVGRLPGGESVALLKATQRARIGTGVMGPGAALWVEAESLDEPAATPRAGNWPPSSSPCSARSCTAGEPGRSWRPAADDHRGGAVGRRRVCDLAGHVRQDRAAGDGRPGPSGWRADRRARAHVAELARQREDQERRRGGHGEDPARVPAAPPARCHPQGARPDRRRRRRGRARRLPGQARGRRPARGASARRSSARSTSSSAPATQSPETGWIRTWLDTVLELPWGVESEDRLDIAEAARILDADHDGLDDVKERILEHLAVRKLQAERGLAPVGRPRLGAPSWPWSGPRASARPRSASPWPAPSGASSSASRSAASRDEAEIRGHRRTYVGAQPGRLVRALREAGTMNPVIVLDEVDKIGADYRGDPSSALLEVLDPAQNHTFRDHYLEVDLDLSRGAVHRHGQRESTPSPGRCSTAWRSSASTATPRTRRSPSPGTTWCDRQLARAALRADEVQVDRRGAARHRGRLHPGGRRAEPRARARQAAAQGGHEARLGRAHRSRRGRRRRRAGLARPAALLLRGGRPHRACPAWPPAWPSPARAATSSSSRPASSDGPEGLTLTGQLGDVMKESAEIALSYVRSHAEELGIDPGAFAGKRFHVHVPAGAVPKDGPSAGVTMTTALVSLLRGVPVRAGGRDDRRGHPAGPGAADRRGQAEGAGRPPGRADRGGPASATGRTSRTSPRRCASS